MVNFISEQQFYFLETAASVAVLGFMDIFASVGDGVDNGQLLSQLMLAVVFYRLKSFKDLVG